MLNLHLLSSKQFDYPIFCFPKARVLENRKKNFGKIEGMFFPSEEVPSIVGFTGFPDRHGVQIGKK